MGIDKIRELAIKQFGGRNPFVDPTSWPLCEKRLSKNVWPWLLDRAGAAKFEKKLPKIFPAEKFASDTEAIRCWEIIGNYYRNQGRYHEALSIYYALYDQFLAAQERSGKWLQKATPLVWIAECYIRLGFPVLAKRYLMLAHCEDCIGTKGKVSQGSGVYFRAVWGLGLPDKELRRYAREIHKLRESNSEDAMFPEWILQRLDKKWMTEIPSPQEAGVYSANTRYVRHLIHQLGEPTGQILEHLAEYVLSCMPGCRLERRQISHSTDYDIVCSMQGFEVDFRSEFGRYFVCECKDWQKPADYTSFAKFCRVLDSIKSRFGILFSKSGISGEGKTKYAEREQLKVFQDRGMVIVVVTQRDLDPIAKGENFISLLRKKYETIRLDSP